MVGTVYLGVTIEAILPEQELRRRTRGGQAVGVESDARMPGLRVTTLAEQWPSLGQHTGMVRSMRCVAQAAVFTDRRMFPQERAALLGVALVTGVVQRLPDEIRCDGIAVSAVTGSAIHLALEKRVRKGLQGFAALELMAIVANGGLRGRLQHGVSRGVARVTVGAGDVIVTVRAAVPAETDVTFVTTQAHGVLDGRWVRVEVAEAQDGGSFLPAAHPARMRVAGTVAGLAL